MKKSQNIKKHNNSSIKIIFMIHRLNVGGTEKRLINLLKGLPRDKFEPILCYLHEPGVLENEIKPLAVKTITLGLKNRNAIITILRIVKLFNKEKPNIVHTFLTPSHIYGGIAACLAKVPLVISSEENLNVKKGQKQHFFIHFILALFGHFSVAVSQAVKNNLVKRARVSPGRVKVIYAGLDVDLLQPKRDIKELRKELGLKDNDFVLGTVSRLVLQKGHVYLLEAFKLFLEHTNKNIILLIIGDGVLKGSLARKATELDISERVKFLGIRLDTPDLFNIIDVFVFPSLWEGFPIALTEAMHHGKAIVASDIPQIGEMITNEKTGLLAPPKNISVLANAIGMLVDNDPLRKRLSVAAKRYAIDNLNLNKMIHSYEELYLSVERRLN